MSCDLKKFKLKFRKYELNFRKNTGAIREHAMVLQSNYGSEYYYIPSSLDQLRSSSFLSYTQTGQSVEEEWRLNWNLAPGDYLDESALVLIM